MQKGCRECGIPFCVLKECIVGASIARPCPFVLQENCPGKCVAAPSRRATKGHPYTCNGQEGVGGPRGGSPGHPLQECGAQFSVTVMVPIVVLSAVVLPNAPFRDSEAVTLPACRALSVLYYGSYAGADEAFLRLGREVKERGLTPAGDPRVLGIVAPYTGREIETKRYCSRLVLPVEGEAEPSFPV